jgi:hypothetical protein
MSYTRKRTSNTATFVYDQNSARKKNAKNEIKEVKTEISNLEKKQVKYERIIKKSIMKHGIKNLAKAHKETEPEHKKQMKCVGLIKKNKEKLLSLEKSLSRSNDLRGGYGYSKNSRKSKKKNHK